ncbi:DUF305 domain-containing protein [Actinopolymorpha alba]|uniref:DUF305 domain-containing protein n=1 Tax=Actinopolymorpha alba TaxID=533267 RepID=UPI000382D018|nr:DUF305 domain-containing protein [Actinopolymorpha alba]
MKRNVALPAGVLAGALLLAGCGGTSGNNSTHDMSTMDSTTSATPTTRPTGDAAGRTSTSSPHNRADVEFATAMIPHHGQAIEMADIALEKATNAEVRRLATAIKAAQAPEIRQLSDWLAGWGEPVPSASMDMKSHDMDMGDGMMSAQEMKELDGASGAAFDRLWTELMIKHHEGAVAMARTQLRQGVSPETKKLAQAVIDGQTKEITTMKALLPTLR